ncbi:MAG: hypothetical protein QOJ39_65 [Candidatus Eremiobacteraeota bacterium]|jgi:hypothetical protein|nr:hypothetical protein [Candidatus Eremiobacteraeota bacterium]
MSSLYRIVLRRGIFISTLLLVALAGTLTSALADGLVYGQAYSCSSGAKFKIVRCAGDSCDLFYINEYSPGGGRMQSVSRSVVDEGLAGGCHVPGQRATAPAASPRTTPWSGYAAMHHETKYGGALHPGQYECYTYSSGRLTSAAAENFTLLGGARYTSAGTSGAVSYAAGSGALTFVGGSLNGMHAVYKAGTDSRNPSSVTFLRRDGNMGDSCDLQH